VTGPPGRAFTSIWNSVNGSAALEGMKDEQVSCVTTNETAAMPARVCKPMVTVPMSLVIFSKYAV
jgi:hypothetical protein